VGLLTSLTSPKAADGILKKKLGGETDHVQNAREALDLDHPVHPHTRFKSMSGSQFQE
jgi:hypothetical protein